MNSKIQKLIKSCNDCILSCEASVKSCQVYTQACSENVCKDNISQDCTINCQKVVVTCQACMHECNQALEHKLYNSAKQEAALKKCVEACKESIKKCQSATQKV